MNLIELFESKQFQDVGTFNSIFKATPILGFSSSSEVEICGITPKGRKIIVWDDSKFERTLCSEGQELFLDIPIDSKKRLVVPKKVVRKPRANRATVEALSPLYKQLKPSEFIVFSALREVGEVQNLAKFSAMLSVDRKTVGKVLKSLDLKGLIATKKEKDVLTISLTL